MKKLFLQFKDKIRFFDLIIDNSLGCKFLTTNNEETEKIKKEFSKKKFFDLDELKEYVALRDVYRRYDIFENSNSLIAGIISSIMVIIF